MVYELKSEMDVLKSTVATVGEAPRITIIIIDNIEINLSEGYTKAVLYKKKHRFFLTCDGQATKDKVNVSKTAHRAEKV